MSEIPSEFSEEERILRILYFPNHLTKDEKAIKAAAFRPPPNFDEISVIRLEYSSPDFCKQHGQKHEDRPIRNYFGFGVVNVREIYSAQANIKYTPNSLNPAHSDIVIGYIPIKGEPLPAEYQIKIDQLARLARLYKDNHLSDKNWMDGQIS